MMAPLGIRVHGEGQQIYLTVIDNRNPDSTITAVLTEDQARELSRMMRNAANFVAAQAPAQGNA